MQNKTRRGVFYACPQNNNAINDVNYKMLLRYFLGRV